MHNSIILVFFNLVHCSFIFGNGWGGIGCTAINFVKHVKIAFVQVGVVCAAWWHLRELSQQSNNINASALLCVLWQNLDEDNFDMLYKNYCWAVTPVPIWTTNVPWKKDKICYHPLITILWFVFLIFRDMVLNLGFLFFIFFFTHTV